VTGAVEDGARSGAAFMMPPQDARHIPSYQPTNDINIGVDGILESGWFVAGRVAQCICVICV
jgi:hypothetical protein